MEQSPQLAARAACLSAEPVFWEFPQASAAPVFSSEYVSLCSTQGEHFIPDPSVGCEVNLSNSGDFHLQMNRIEVYEWLLRDSRKRRRAAMGKSLLKI